MAVCVMLATAVRNPSPQGVLHAPLLLLSSLHLGPLLFLLQAETAHSSSVTQLLFPAHIQRSGACHA